jgi:hypothetical protein
MSLSNPRRARLLRGESEGAVRRCSQPVGRWAVGRVAYRHRRDSFRITACYSWRVPAGDDDYDGVRYEDMEFSDIDWTEVGDHDPGRRSERKGTSEQNVPVEWATEACQDPRRWVRSAGSRSGRTVKVTGASQSAAFVVTVVVAPKDAPPGVRWYGATAWKAKPSEEKQYRGED